MSALQVWMNGEPVATWERGDRGGRLTYAQQWLASPASRPLSLSLPLLPIGESHRGEVVGNYFENLLPDSSDIRTRIRDRFGLRSTATFERGPRQLDPHRAELAMALAGKNRHRRLREIRRRHWNETARGCGIAEGAEPWIAELLGQVEPAIASVESQLPVGFPDRVATRIFNGVRDAALRLADMPPDA